MKFVSGFFAIVLLIGPRAAIAQTPLLEPAMSNRLNERTLAYHLSTNAVRRTNGFAGRYPDFIQITAPASTNLDRITKAVWSQNFWLKNVSGLSATAIGYSNVLGGQGLPTMVSPRHYICAMHMHPESHMMAFLDTNNVVYWRTTSLRIDATNDIAVGILNADLPPSVGFLPVVPANLTDYLPARSSSYIQGIGMNQDLARFSQPMVLGNPGVVVWNHRGVIPLGLGPGWSVALRGGDSSNPETLLIGNQLVLVSHNFASAAGPNYGANHDVVNRAMHFLSTNRKVKTDYQLTVFSLTNWPVVR